MLSPTPKDTSMHSLTEEQTDLYRVMNQADGPFYFANDWLSHAGWQEGAIQSARHTVAAIDKRVQARRA